MTVPDQTRRRSLALLGGACVTCLAGCMGNDTTPDDQTPSPADGAEELDNATTTATETGDANEATTLTASIVGRTANVDSLEDAAGSDLQASIADELPDVAESDVQIVDAADAVEVRADVDPAAVAAALQAVGFDVDESAVSRGVTEQTRRRLRDVLQARLSEAGYEDAAVSQAGEDGQQVALDVPSGNRSDVADVIDDRGRVQIVASFPATAGDGADGGTDDAAGDSTTETTTGTTDGQSDRRTEPLLTRADFREVGEVRQPTGRIQPAVPVTLAEPAAERFADALQEYGFTDEGIQRCGGTPEETDDPGWCLSTVVDGETIYAAGLGGDLATAMRNGDFADEATFVLTTADVEAAEELRRYLVAGELPVTLDPELAD